MSDWITEYYADVDGMNLDAYVAHHAEDAEVIFANNPPAVGRAAIGASIGGFWTLIGGLRHEVHHRWDVNDGNTVVLEVTTHYATHGGAAVSMPCVSILDRNTDGQVTSLRVHIDLAPLFVAIQAEAPETASV